MSESFKDRLSHAWNVFRGKENSFPYPRDFGMSYNYNPSLPQLRLGHEQSILASLLTRIATDVSSVDIKHVRIGQNGRYEETIKSGLNDCLTLSANIDQTGRSFMLDVALSLFDEGCIAIVPTDTTINPSVSGSYEINSLRTGKILEWFPEDVRIEVYNEKEGKKRQILMPKKTVAIVENPLYQIMNAPNSTLQRLNRKLNLLDVVDEQIGSGKIDMVIQLPYVVRNELRRKEAERRRDDIEQQLIGSKYGVAYVDAAEKITQLNRPVENNMLSQVEYLTTLFYSQLGISKEVFEGTATEEAMLIYYSRTVEPVLNAIVEAMRKSFLTKTARTQGQTIMYFRDPFKLAPLSKITEMADTFIRNQILSANEIRAIMGYQPDMNPQSDQLINPNMPQEGMNEQLMVEGGADEMTEEDYQMAFADLDEIDAQLDELEMSLDDDVRHYASPYYDPVKAHEYYMKNRELKGRKSTAGLSDKGKQAARYVKEQLTSERKEKQQDVRDETNANIADVKSQAEKALESARDRKKQQLEAHKAAMNAKIDSLKRTIEGLKGDEKKEKSAAVRTEISGLREENKKQREELNAEYKEYSARVRENRSDEISELRSDSSRERKGLKTEYDEKYIEELERIKKDPSMLKQKKAKSGSKGTKSKIKYFRDLGHY